MKMAKRILAAAAACAVTLGISAVSVFADIPAGGRLELGAAPTVVNNDTQKGWSVDGTDDISTPFSLADFKAARYLVLELSSPPVGGVQFIIQSDGDNWAWNQNDGIVGDDGQSEPLIVIDLTAMKGYEGIQAAEDAAKVFVAYYSNNFDDLGIVNAFFVGDYAGGAETAPAPAPAEESEAAPEAAPVIPRTGNASVIAIVSVMAIAGTAAVIAKKRK